MRGGSGKAGAWVVAAAVAAAAANAGRLYSVDNVSAAGPGASRESSDIQTLVAKGREMSAVAGAEPRCLSAPQDAARVRREIEQAYAANEAGFLAKDPEAVMKLRHPDFHTVDHAGKLSTREEMHERTRRFIGRIEKFHSLRETIRELELHGDTAIASVYQETSRAQRFPDGELHTVETTVHQREWWRCTPDGWRMWRVDEVEQGTLLVDGKPPE